MHRYVIVRTLLNNIINLSSVSEDKMKLSDLKSGHFHFYRSLKHCSQVGVDLYNTRGVILNIKVLKGKKEI